MGKTKNLPTNVFQVSSHFEREGNWADTALGCKRPNATRQACFSFGRTDGVDREMIFSLRISPSTIVSELVLERCEGFVRLFNAMCYAVWLNKVDLRGQYFIGLERRF